MPAAEPPGSEVPRDTRLAVAEGVSLNARVWPLGDERPFLLVHGLASNCRTWDGVARQLNSCGHPVASLDLRGHGLSDKPDEGYDFPRLIADLSVAIAALGLVRPVVVGQSTGGNLAVELGARHPERVAGVAGVDGGIIDLQRRWPRWEDCEAALAPPPLSGIKVEEFEAMVREGHPDWSEVGVAATVANMEALSDGTVRPLLSADRHIRILRALWEHRPLAVLPRLQVPLLLLLADSDETWTVDKRQDAAGAEAASPGVRVEWLSGDHDLHVQQPQAVANLLRSATWSTG